MALKKQIELPNGATGNYLKVGLLHMDFVLKEASAHLHLYASKEKRLSNPDALLRPTAAKIRLHGRFFDQFLSDAAMKSSGAVGDPNHVAQIYSAFNHMMQVYGTETGKVPLNSLPGFYLISDFDLTGAVASE